MSLVGTRPILPGELEQYELHHRTRIAINSFFTKDDNEDEECSIRNELIYVYFPALSAKYKKNFEEEDIDITLYEIINKDDDMSCDAIA